jgi:pyruvate/2-oxoglutarate dehydrogenase complex dihydrolipoamide acyltransferase (E2) component
MKAVPSANASWMDIVVHVYDLIHINVVVGTANKLLYTPVVQDCGGKGLKSMSDELKGAVSAVKSGEVTPDFASMGIMKV